MSAPAVSSGAASEKPARLKTADVMALLRERYAMDQGFAMLENVANGVGSRANGRRRFADALAMMQWGSSGHFLHGFEVKVSRADWLRELKDESKADSVYRYCDFWWVVAGDAAIVKDGELPKGWGLLVPRGSALVTKVQAERQVDVVVHDRAFVASIFRRAKEQQVDRRLIDQARTEARAAERQLQERLAENRQKRLADRVEELERTIREFEQASGLKLSDAWWAGYGSRPEQIGQAVKLLLAGERNVAAIHADLNRLRMQTESIQRRIAEALNEPANRDPATW